MFPESYARVEKHANSSSKKPPIDLVFLIAGCLQGILRKPSLVDCVLHVTRDLDEKPKSDVGLGNKFKAPKDGNTCTILVGTHGLILIP